MSESAGTALITQDTEVIRRRERRKASLVVTEAGRIQTSDGLYHHGLVFDFLMKHRSRYVTVKEITKLCYVHAMPKNQEKIRRRLPGLFVECVVRGQLLVIERDAEGRPAAVKIYDPHSDMDEQLIRPELDRRAKRKEITAHIHALALDVLDLLRASVQPEHAV